MSHPTEPTHPTIATEARDLACQLTDTERLDRGARMAAAAEQAAALKLEASVISKQARSHALEAGRIATIVHSGYEMRTVTCEWRADYAARTKTAYRTDTGEALETLQLTAEELQLTLGPAIAPPTSIQSAPAGMRRGGRGRARLAVVPGAAPNTPAMITHHEYPDPSAASAPVETPPPDSPPVPPPTSSTEQDHAEV